METGTTEGQAGRKEGDLFVSNGREHYTHTFRKMVAALVALPLGGVFIGGILVYRSSRTEVREIIVEHPAIIGMQKDIETLQKQQVTLDGKYDSLYKFLTQPSTPTKSNR